MSTLIENVQATLSPLVAGGCWYATNTAQPPVFPFITFQRIVSPTNNSFAGPSDVQNTIFQIDIFSRQMSELIPLQATIEAAFVAATYTAIQQDQRDGYEPDIKAFRCSMDYSCWSAN